MLIPNCMLYTRNNNPNHADPDFYKKMMENVLGTYIKKVYVDRCGSFYNVLILFNPIPRHKINNIHEDFINVLNHRNPIIVEYEGKDYKVYED